jgi:hypothetical protein
MAKNVTKSEHDAGKDLKRKKSSKIVKELSGKVLEQKAQINKLKKQVLKKKTK